MHFEPLLPRLRQWAADLSRFPWKTTALTLRERFREDRLDLTASSLTFTTLLALVPFITVALAVFTAFPMFDKVQYGLQKWLVDSLVPDSISRQVLGYLTQFASKASRLGVVGLTFLLVTALALILTIDRTLNAIWRVRRPRPLGQRVLIYWAAITLGPLALGLSLALTSYVVSASRGLVDALPGGVRFVFDAFEFCVLAGGMAGLYRFVPNTQVAWGHAWSGGLFVAVGIELAKRVLSAYLVSVPTYSTVYGAFATLPILLVWIYVAWVIVLLGAVVAAYLPSLLAGVARRGGGPGWPFQLAVEVLQRLHAARAEGAHGLPAVQIAQALRVEPLQIVPVLETLVALDWVGQLCDADDGEGRYVLLADADATPLAPLVERLLLEPTDATRGVWQGQPLAALRLRDVLAAPA
ncbi:YihY family inner membrane protein [Ramlibacter sp. H39-3-26]|nr:YihY family inner membrane protein [Ramlibacter sp. H39-3-26]MDF1484048.1 YihY family inner membrane protein [Ramlibacter sp. H39-3-26]